MSETCFGSGVSFRPLPYVLYRMPAQQYSLALSRRGHRPQIHIRPRNIVLHGRLTTLDYRMLTSCNRRQHPDSSKCCINRPLTYHVLSITYYSLRISYYLRHNALVTMYFVLPSIHYIPFTLYYILPTT